MRILGIDPGSRVTGFGFVDVQGNHYRHVENGTIRLPPKASLTTRLHKIFTDISALMKTYQPDQVAVEQVFVNKTVQSALVLGQARGAAICAVGVTLPEIAEYTPTQIKQALVGSGRADKAQIQYMVTMLLNLSKKPSEDAADALACALCHAQHQHWQQAIVRGSK